MKLLTLFCFAAGLQLGSPSVVIVTKTKGHVARNISGEARSIVIHNRSGCFHNNEFSFSYR